MRDESQVRVGGTSVDRAWIESVRAEYGHCFGCGRDNPMGLRVDGFARDGDSVRASFTPRPEYLGFHGILHGGVLATALDEILGWTTILVGGHMAVTATLELKYRKPAPPDVRYDLVGSLDEVRGRRLMVSATCSYDSTVVAEASGLFLATEPVPGP